MTPLRREQDERDDGEHWVFDRRIPLALIFTIMFQFTAVVWWNSKIDSRVARLEVDHIDTVSKIKETDRENRSIDNRLVRLEEKSNAILEILKQYVQHQSQLRQNNGGPALRPPAE